MPTPFYHLDLAEESVRHPALPQGGTLLLARHRNEFLFGNTAPVVQMVSGQAREETHFFTHLPRQALQAYRQGLIQENIALLMAYVGE